MKRFSQDKGWKFILLSTLIIFFFFQSSKDSFSESIKLTLEECINTALKNNLDLQIETLNVDISDEDINAQKSTFDPYFQSNFYLSNSESPNTYVLEEVTNLKTRSLGKSIGISQKLSSGTTYDVSLSSSRRKYNASLQGLNPTYNTQLNFSLKQPLLKNFGLDVNKVYVSLALNNKKISIIELKQKISEIIYTVINAYWYLVYRIEDLDVKTKSLNLARELLELNKIQIEVGTLAPVEIYQAESAVVTREEALIVAENAVKEAKDNLLNNINLKDGKYILEDQEILLEEIQPKRDYEIDLQECVSNALSNNHDLKKSKIYLDNWDKQIKYTKNQMLPEVDLSGSMTFNGLSGKSSYEGYDYPYEGDYFDAYDTLMHGDYYNYSISVELSFPLLNRSARSSHAKNNIGKRKQIIMIKQLENEVILGVKNLVRSIETNWKRIEVTSKSIELTKKKLEVEQEKYKLGLATNFTVLDYQEDLAIAENAEVKAKIDYQISIVSLKNLEGTLLEDYQFFISSNKDNQEVN